jgi:hypothetical protein
VVSEAAITQLDRDLFGVARAVVSEWRVLAKALLVSGDLRLAPIMSTTHNAMKRPLRRP